MNTVRLSKDKVSRMLVNVLSIFIILALAFPTTGSASAEESTAFTGRDEFDGSLTEGWYWVNENSDAWNLTEQSGFLRIYTSAAGTGSENLLLRPVAEGDFMIKTRLLFEPDANYQIAGLVIWQDQENFLQLGRAFCDVEGACVGNGLYFDRISGGDFVDGNFATSIDNPSDVFLRLERRGNMVRAFYSADGGTSWYEIGTHWLPDGFQVNGVGLTAAQDVSDLNIPADFDFFELTEGRGFLPEGYHDAEQGDVPSWACYANGWAADPDDRTADVNIEIVVDHQTVATLPAGDFRQDLADANVCADGNCSFSAGLWGLVSSYEPHRVDTWAQDDTGEWVLLNNSAKTLTCRTYDLYTYDPTTGTTKEVTNLRDTHEFNPRWSPDAKMIVHDSWSTDWSSHGVYITNVKTGVSTPLGGAEGGTYPTWSPSGKWIAFDRDNSLFIVPSTGGNAKLVVEDAFMATWAPNSTRLAFQKPSDGSIRTVSVRGERETLVTERGNGPAWSPDGDWIAYEMDGDLWKIRVNNTGNPIGVPIQLTSTPMWEGRPTWSFNSKTIAFHAGMGQDTDIWTIPAAGGTATWLTGAPNFGDYDANYSLKGQSNFLSYASFSPDGQAARNWIANFSYDVGTWAEGEHSYFYETTYSVPWSWNGTTNPITFDVSPDASLYNGTVLLRPFALRARVGNGCPAVNPLLNPEQSTRFSYGWQTDFPMTYAEALDHFNSLAVTAHWDEGMSAELQREEIFSTSAVDYGQIVCASTEAPAQPVLYVHYEYPDVVEGDYELGHTVQVTVFDSEWNTKATATVETMEMPHWGGAPGFRVEQWDGMDGPPDIQPGDVVRAVVDGGPLMVETRIGEIRATVDPEANSVTGTINAPWAGNDVSVLCMPWGAPEGTSPGDLETTVTPDGVSTFTCTWDSSAWDIQPGASAGVAYWGSDLHWIANVAPNPWMLTFPEPNQVFGYGWPTGSEVSLTINDEYIATATVQGAPWDQNDIMAFFDFGAMHDLVAGDVVKLTGSGMERTHIVQNLLVTDINMEADTVSGTADNGVNVHAWVHGYGRDVQIDVTDGTWNAYFGGDDFHLQPGMCGRAEIRVEGNSTNVDWCIPNPRFGVRANADQVEAWHWNVGETLTLTIDDPDTPENPDFTDTRTVEVASWDPNQTYAFFNLWDNYDIQTEDVVSLSNGPLTKTTIVTNLAFTDIDLELNVVTGTAAPASRVDVWACDNINCINRHINADGAGIWTADFSNFGDEGDEQNTFNLVPGTWIDSSQNDEDNDQTYWGERVPNPYVEAAPYSDWIHAREWPIGTEMTLEIDDPSNGPGIDYTDTAIMQQAPWNPGDPNDILADFRWPDQFAPGPGYVLTMSGNGQTKTLILSDLRMTSFDVEADTISGVGTPNAQIQVCANVPNRCITRWVTADGDGNWTADYKIWAEGDDPEPFDVQPGSNGWAADYEADSDRTWFDWWIPNPIIIAHPDQEWVEGWSFQNGSEVQLTIYDGDGALMYQGTATAAPPDWNPGDPNAFVRFDVGYDMKAGDHLWMTDGESTKDLIITGLMPTGVDPGGQLIHGVADPNSDVTIEHQGAMWTVTADTEGTWSASLPSLARGSDALASQWDEDGDMTRIGFHIPNTRFTVWPEQNYLEGYEWPDGALISIEVAGKDVCSTQVTSGFPEWDPWNTFFSLNFPEGCDIVAGDSVTLSSEWFTFTHQVGQLAITEVDADNDTVSGTATFDPEQYMLHTWIHGVDGSYRQLSPVSENWVANYGFDLQPGMGGRVELVDQFSNATATEWYISNPRIIASITEDWFYVNDFAPNTELDFAVYASQGGSLIWAGTTPPTDGSGHLWVNAEDRWNLEPGVYLTVTDGASTKDLVIEGFTFDVFNLTNGHFEGTAPGPAGRRVWAGIGWQDGGWSADVFTDAEGNWTADYGNPVPTDYWWVAAQIFDNDSDATELRPALILP